MQEKKTSAESMKRPLLIVAIVATIVFLALGGYVLHTAKDWSDYLLVGGCLCAAFLTIAATTSVLKMIQVSSKEGALDIAIAASEKQVIPEVWIVIRKNGSIHWKRLEMKEKWESVGDLYFQMPYDDGVVQCSPNRSWNRKFMRIGERKSFFDWEVAAVSSEEEMRQLL